MERDSERIGFPPPHPGEYLREDIVPALNMTVTDLADHLGVSRASLSELIHCKRGVSIQMAIRLGQAFQTGARFWVALQGQHDLWREEQRFSDNIMPLPTPDNEIGPAAAPSRQRSTSSSALA